jgi:acyl dehydratase
MRSLREGVKAVVPVRFSAAELDSFAVLSGDRNPIHLDEAYARARGFEGRVVYGALIAASISRLLGEEIPGAGCVWHSLALEFKAPLYAGQDAELTGEVSYWSDEHRIVKLKLELRRGDALLARGTAQAGVSLEKAA